MKRFFSLLPAVFGLLLAGCGQGSGPSASVSSDNTSKSTQDETIRRTSTLSADSSSKSVSTVSAATYIFKTIGAEYPSSKKFDDALWILGKNPKAFEKAFDQLQHSSGLSDDAFSAAIVAFAVRPRLGWPLDPMTEVKNRNAFVRTAQAAIEFTNEAAALVVAQLPPAAVFRDEQEVRNQIIESFRALNHADLKSLMVKRVKDFELDKVDLAGDGNIHFLSTDGREFVADQTGFRFSSAGHLVFGQDVIATKKIQISFETSSSSRKQKDRSVNTTESTDQSNSQKASVEVK